jgi:imidazolonepropionase
VADFVLIRNARVVTMGDAGTLSETDVRVEGGCIAEIGHGLSGPPGASIVEAAGRVLMPGLIDAHTHACWAGNRMNEWEQRLAGANYLELLSAGGGIMSTVRAVRATDQQSLTDGLLQRLVAMLKHGTTTVEVKSGYGLDTQNELKMLRAIVDAGRQWAGTVVPTACIGHANDPSEADPVGRTLRETLPAVSREFPGIVIDAYCEQSAWTVPECVELFERAIELGHPVRVHTDQFNSLGMVDEAVRLGARSVDHLEASSVQVLQRVGQAGMHAVLLPCSGFHVDGRYADGRALIDAGAKVVVATNCNPGSAPCVSLPMAMALAVRHCGLTCAEVLRAVTLESAGLLGFADRGRLQKGLRADLILLDSDDERVLGHDFGGNPVSAVMAGGRWV